MTRVLGRMEYEIKGSQSILAFETQGGGSWKVWDRYLAVHGNRVYHIGNVCGTCRFFFEEVGGMSRGKEDNVTAEQLVNVMTQGLRTINLSFLDAISSIIPNGQYLVALMETTPRLVTPGADEDYFAHENVDQWGLNEWELPHYPKVKYYRGVDQTLPNEQQAFEFIVPLYPHRWLNEERVSEFASMIRAGGAPTAIALSILDTKQAWNEDYGHWCLTHYLVDGHHKVMAASQEGKPLSLLAFIAVDQGISSREELDQLLDFI